MEEQKLKERLLNLFSNHFGIPRADLKEDLALERDLNATKLELSDFYLLLEDMFRLKIEETDSEHFATVGDIINFVIDHDNTS